MSLFLDERKPWQWSARLHRWRFRHFQLLDVLLRQNMIRTVEYFWVSPISMNMERQEMAEAMRRNIGSRTRIVPSICRGSTVSEGLDV